MVPLFASTWRAGSEAEIGLRSASTLAPGTRLLLRRHAEEFARAPRTLTSPAGPKQPPTRGRQQCAQTESRYPAPARLAPAPDQMRGRRDPLATGHLAASARRKGAVFDPAGGAGPGATRSQRERDHFRREPVAPSASRRDLLCCCHGCAEGPDHFLPLRGQEAHLGLTGALGSGSRNCTTRAPCCTLS
jgi:hypothetical protein